MSGLSELNDLTLSNLYHLKEQIELNSFLMLEMEISEMYELKRDKIIRRT